MDLNLELLQPPSLHNGEAKELRQHEDDRAVRETVRIKGLGSSCEQADAARAEHRRIPRLQVI